MSENETIYFEIITPSCLSSPHQFVDGNMITRKLVAENLKLMAHLLKLPGHIPLLS